MAASNAAAARASVKNNRSEAFGIPSRKREGVAPNAPSGNDREYGSLRSGPAMTASTVAASSVVSAKIEMQSSERQAGTTPVVETRPRLGLRPTMLLRAAGTRPDPAVSVPSATGTSPAATATADPELEPPGISAGSSVLRGVP